MKHWLLSMVVAGLVAFAQDAASPTQAKAKSGEIGSSLPGFRVKDLRGNLLSSDDLMGKVILIDFWATWCVPCKQEMPGYQKLLDRYGSQGLVVIGLKSNVMADTENPLKFARKAGVRYPLAVATDELTGKFGGIEGLPTTLVYDRKGVLRKKVIGFEYSDVLESELKALL